MSIALQKLVWKLSISPSEKIVLLKLADYASDKDHCAYPSVSTLAGDTGLSERQVQRHLSASVEGGHIVIDENPNGGRGHTRTYRFTLVKGDNHDTHKSIKRVTPTTVKGDVSDTVSGSQRVTSETQRVTPTTVKGDTHDATYIRNEPSENHQGEPSVVKPMPRHGDAQVLVATLYEEILNIGSPTNYKQAVGQAGQLVKAGCTPDELREIAGWLLRDSFWSQKGINMGTILSQRDKWRASKQASADNQSWGIVNGGNSGPGPRGYTAAQLIAMSREENVS